MRKKRKYKELRERGNRAGRGTDKKNYEKIDNLDRNENYERMRSWIEMKAQIVLKGLIAWGLGVMKGLIGH